MLQAMALEAPGISWYAGLMILAFGFMIFAGAVLTGDAAFAHMPKDWFVHDQGNKSSLSAVLYVLEYGVTLLFRTILVICAVNMCVNWGRGGMHH